VRELLAILYAANVDLLMDPLTTKDYRRPSICKMVSWSNRRSNGNQPTLRMQSDSAQWFSDRPEIAEEEADVVPMNARVAPVYLRPLLEEARRLDIEVPRLLHGLGFSCGDLESPGFAVSLKEAFALIRHCLAVIDDPKLGVQLGMRSNIVDRGALGLGMLASATLGDAIDLAQRFPASAGFLLDFRVERSGSNHLLIAAPMTADLDVEAFLADTIFSGMVSVRRKLTGTKYSPAYIELTRQKPRNAQVYVDHFQCPVRFASMRNSLVTGIDWLDFPLPTASTPTFGLALQLLEAERSAWGDFSSIGAVVERKLRMALPDLPTQREVASLLNLSERTLRRKLADTGLRFHDLIDQSRRSRAMSLIENPRLSFWQVASEAGFTDVRSFRRAFKRWTGRNPSDVRRKRLPLRSG
jgi:AraC-like DNA-binding protein